MSLISGYDQIANSSAQRVAAIATGQDSPLVTAAHGADRKEPAERGGLAAMLMSILDDAGEAIYRDRDAARACIARASALLRDGLGHEHAPVTVVRGGLAPWQIARVRAHIEAHLDSTIRMRDLAAVAHLSTGHFSRSFTRSLGVAPFAYITGRRLARAQNLMLTTQDPLRQIALACGLYDQSHLTRLFRRHIGTSPNAWRRFHRGGPAAQPAPASPMDRKLGHLPCRSEHRAPLLAHLSA